MPRTHHAVPPAVCIALALIVGGPDQSAAGFVVAPAGLAETEGNARFAPVDWPHTLQQVYGSATLGGLPAGSVITGISLRLDSWQAAYQTGPYTYSRFDLDLGPSNFAPGGLLPVFAGNQGPGTTRVRRGPLTLDMSAFPQGGYPNGFGPVIPFSAPYTYTGGDLLLTAYLTAVTLSPYWDFALGMRGDGANGVQFRLGIGGNDLMYLPASYPGGALIARFEYTPPPAESHPLVTTAVPAPATLPAALAGVAAAWALARRRAARMPA